MAGALALVMGLTFAAPPATTAAEAAKVPMSPVHSRLSVVTAARLAALAPSPRAFAQTQSSTSSAGESKSFFSTPAGVVAIVLMVAGAGFAVYSANHDRKPVKSPIR